MIDQPQGIDRRRFLKTSVAALGTAAIGFPDIIPARALAAPGRPGANDRIVIGHIGIGGRGNGLLGYSLSRVESGKVAVAAVCDVDEARLRKALIRVGPNATAYRDYRYLLERKDIDAVVIGTPDHWHAVGVVHAAESRKHIYVEKPACCTIDEGKAMVRAGRENKVCIQVGSQGRSQAECYKANRYIANGNIGTVNKVICWHYESPVDSKPVPDSAPPPDLDWDLWLGPLPWRPYNAKYCPGTFRWIMESGGGQIRDRGAHVMSNALWIMNADRKMFASPKNPAPPVTIDAKGTLPMSGLWDTAVTMDVTYQFRNPDWTMVWSQPGEKIPYFDEEKRKKLGIRDTYGATYHGSSDKLVVWVGDGQVYTELKAVDWTPGPGAKDVHRSPDFDHTSDWLHAIRTGTEPVMNIEAGVAAAYLTVLGNLSLILGRKLTWDPVKQEIIGDEQARRMMSRPQRYPYVV
ncbi:MAG: Gfo/Idh/MocA family oxidoreductase [Opitutaceae bacterium]|nr:Gfo/Idh/MocA family oxidoreductase [Opitutaceae bacterium]